MHSLLCDSLKDYVNVETKVLLYRLHTVLSGYCTELENHDCRIPDKCNTTSVSYSIALVSLYKQRARQNSGKISDLKFFQTSPNGIQDDTI